MNAPLVGRFRTTMTAILAVLYASVGLAGSGSVRVAGLLGATAILASLVLAGRSRRPAIPLLVLGVAPLVALTWWSIATPVIAIACLALGWPRRTQPMRVPRGQAPAGMAP